MVIKGRRGSTASIISSATIGEGEREKQKILSFYPDCKGRNPGPVTQTEKYSLSTYYVLLTIQGTEDPEMIRA